MASPLLGPYASYKSAPPPRLAAPVRPRKPRRHWLLVVATSPVWLLVFLLAGERRPGQWHPIDILL